MENQNKTLIEEDAPKPCTPRSLWETSKEAPGSSLLKKLAQFWPFHPIGVNGRPLLCLSLFFFLLERRIYRGETERKILCLMIHSLSELNGRCCADLKPGASSWTPTRVQGPKALGCPILLSRATSRELEGKQGCWDRTGAHMGSRACKARTLTTCATTPGPPLSLLRLNEECQWN